MSHARPVLERLLRRAENARRRGVDERVSQPMAGVGEYTTSLASLPELEAFHAEIALAERAGAIAVQRDVHRGDGAKLLRLTVADLSALARHLGTTLLDERVAAAAQRLAPWRARFPVLDDALAAWREGRKLRGHGPEAAEELADAAHAVTVCADDAGHERILRRESVRLFGDSKRLEKLTPWLELLVTGELAASGLAKEEVWSSIGLRREPQPLLLAGRGTLTLTDATLPLVRPFLGVPVESLQAVASTARCVLSIENLASFHDAARANGAADVLLLYTGGMPSPAWRAAYVRVLCSLAPEVPVFHWGDIDEGGFRIAATLTAAAREAGRTLQPWLMSPAALPADALRDAEAPAPALLAAMRHWAGRAGWPQVADALARQPVRLEQERLDPVMP
ncbi:MAG TPA: Wadjet anti-phage system protein JetD domain-containing protein [Rhodanobacter sp.]|nr:Wadjet anti-phage system protein JetD domain-containing protein [Rhodanobacter sp.]